MKLKKYFKKPMFVYILTAISILSFISIILKYSSGFDLNPLVETLIFLLIGMGLIIQSRIRVVIKNGIQRDEVLNVVALVVGIAILITGLLGYPLFNIDNPIFNAYKILASSIAILVIALNTFVTKD